MKKTSIVSALLLLLLVLSLASAIPAHSSSPSLKASFSVAPGQTYVSPPIWLVSGVTLNATIAAQSCASDSQHDRASIILTNDITWQGGSSTFMNVGCSSPATTVLSYTATFAANFSVSVSNSPYNTGLLNGTVSISVYAAPQTTTTSTTTTRTTTTQTTNTSGSTVTFPKLYVYPGQYWVSPLFHLNKGDAVKASYALQICRAGQSHGPEAGVGRNGTTVLVVDLSNSYDSNTFCWTFKGTASYTANVTASDWEIWVSNPRANPVLYGNASYSILAAPYFVTINNSATNTTSATPVQRGQSFTLSAPNETYYAFTGWVGSGTGSYTGPLQRATITPKGNVTETAQYAYDQWGAFYGTNFQPFVTVGPELVFEVSAIVIVVLLFSRAVDFDPFQAKHLGSVIGLFSLLVLIGFPFFYLNFTGNILPMPQWSGSWIFGNWFLTGQGQAFDFLYNIPILGALPGIVLAFTLLRKARYAEGTGPKYNSSHNLITAVYTVMAFLYIQGSGIAYSLYNPPQTPYAFPVVSVMFGLIMIVASLPVYFFTKPATPMNLTFRRPSRKLIGTFVPLALLALYFAPHYSLPAVRIVTPYQITMPLLASLVSVGLVTWRRSIVRTNGLFLAAFISSLVSIILISVVGPSSTVTRGAFVSLFPFLLFLSLPVLAVWYRSSQSKTWLALAFVLSLFGFIQVLFFLRSVYELIFNVKSLPSLKAPRMKAVPAETAIEELKKEESK